MPRLELSPDHRAWVVENLLDGVDEAALVKALSKQVSRTRARREVRAIATSPLLPVCARLAKRARQLELVAALGRAHQRGETTVERRTTPSADEFFRTYWAGHRPVVLTDATARWPALKKWTPAWFAQQFATTTIEITAGRNADPNYDMNYLAHRKRVRMREFIAEIETAGKTNDLYLVSNNHTMKKKPFARLLRDVKPPRALFELPLRGAATSLWIGPAGTITPLHHDTTNILLTQIYGRKRIELVSPQETALLLEPVGFYSPVDLDRRARAAHPAVRAMTVKSVVVGPGDALFIPAGWWHRVTSLDVSISFSLLGFRKPNDFDWYRPGHIA